MDGVDGVEQPPRHAKIGQIALGRLDQQSIGRVGGRGRAPLRLGRLAVRGRQGEQVAGQILGLRPCPCPLGGTLRRQQDEVTVDIKRQILLGRPVPRLQAVGGKLAKRELPRLAQGI